MKTHICFHGIGTCLREREAGEAVYWVTKGRFLELLDEIAAHPSVSVSFDDGNRSDADIALPALEQRGLRATFFALAGRLDDPASLSGADLRDLRGAGMTIGSHGWEHVPWRGLSPRQATRELVDARHALEDAGGTTITEAALPLGRYDRQVLRRLKDAGYRAVYTSDRFPVREHSWLRARYSITHRTTPASVAALTTRWPGVREARNLVASGVKRIR